MNPLSQRHDPKRIRVLYVAGTGRSGSTVISNLLGSAPGLTSVGELRYLWERGLAERALCGCGEPVASCPFWGSALASAYASAAVDPAVVQRADSQLLRLRAFPALLRAHGDPQRLGASAMRYTDELARIYSAVAEQTDGDVIVDASKLVSFGYLLSHVPGLDVFVLHLVRDPRGAAYSWARKRERSDRGAGDRQMGRESALKSSLLWDVWNGSAERLWARAPQRYVRVRYEDVVADPARALAPVLAMLAMPDARLPILADGRVAMGVNHTVAGNPNRMAGGPLQLVDDDEWTRLMRPSTRRLVTGLTAPLLRRYGYPLAPRTHVFVEDLAGAARLRARIARNAVWIKEQGLARALEEKEIDPLRTVPVAVRKLRYRRAHADDVGLARPVFVVGLQRSGTNMLTRGLGMAAQVEVHNENDSRAFERYKLRPASVIESIIATSRHSHVLFKPLCDSHRTDELLDDLKTATPARAVWAYRDVDGRVRSALAKFGDGNRRVLQEFADGSNTERWHVQRMSRETTELVRSFDYSTMSAASGAALMWVVRNRLYFDLGLDRRFDVLLVSYLAFLNDPAATMRQLCGFLDFPYTASLIEQVTTRAPTYREPLDIDPRIREQCSVLADRLEVSRVAQLGIR